jgi:class 3 adenylate cyclase
MRRSLFPAEVHDRLYKAAEESIRNSISHPPKSMLQNFLSDETGRKGQGGDDQSGTDVLFPGQVYKTKPIADLFLECTVMFADICGFTAWSSVREPSQVFALLECIYNTFDGIARKDKVFKVETIGDCYVAVCGLPEANADHAAVMARFAHRCIVRMRDLMQQLELSLGPDTSELTMRFGLHSGPVTAGVLRGEKSRFQLFGDTVNTAARMESTGERSRIHCSETTVQYLTASGKGHWAKKRDDKLEIKGKGHMQTYWLRPKLLSDESVKTDSDCDLSVTERGDLPSEEYTLPSSPSKVHSRMSIVPSQKNLPAKTQRLVDWVANMLIPLLERVVAQREAAKLVDSLKFAQVSQIETAPIQEQYVNTTVLEEFQEIITLPKFNAKVAQQQASAAPVELSQPVKDQLTSLVGALASMYHDHPFHNFEHASHVTMSVVKLLSRIVAPDNVQATLDSEYDSRCLMMVHDHTYGITSDPLTQFAVVLSGLIHDVDHPGVPNATLVQEGTPLAKKYKNKSVAEQNSVDLAWSLLLQERYDDQLGHGNRYC